ncbi:hypothetical protein G5B38_06165 [Pseudohalocynthiibacter aestuariivivens]|uniref:Invasion associated locus B family protein n=1 Tax=Roseovarius pelagicus TaxID=2980108 RepID=A0ABY6D9V5_9RHOB|nr:MULTISPECIES: invasion associated locus B family protein [Rhodobacterales]QIE45147.1 hypothetical protein G5B38_06165 [Pseudohalocynthiibacter aestuariivivens]UXX82916.1 invasion associated locus B family protein [Roseovarius pelagicus]
MFAIVKSIVTLPISVGLICAGFAVSVNAQEAEQPKRTTEVFGDWTVECIAPPAKADSAEKPAEQCEMRTQVTVRGEDDVQRPLIQLGIGQLGLADDFWIVIQTPLKVVLQDGVRFVLSSTESDDPDADEALVKTRFLYCEKTHCVSQGRMGTVQLDALGDADGARVIFVAAPEKKLEIPLSLDGFSEARAAFVE